MKLENPFKKEKKIVIDECTEVFCTLQIEGTHNWPDCPFQEVDYLKVPHRHIFHIKAYKRVIHDDRDVEFIMLKHEIQEYIINKYKDSKSVNAPTSRSWCAFGAKSCEMIASELCTIFKLTRCEVSEDNENGAIVTRHCKYE